MREENIENMNFKELRAEVQLLRDELAIFKRKYEDAIYNLDSSNFSSRLVKEQKGMVTAIEITSKGLKTKVSREDLNDTLASYSTIEQTADAITATVTAEYVNGLIGGDYVTNAVLSSKISQSTSDIMLNVSKDYETKTDANATYAKLEGNISTSADNILLSVSGTYQTQSSANADYAALDGKIESEKDRITDITNGTYTYDLLNNYFTGIDIAPDSIKMISGGVYSIYSIRVFI